MLPHQGLPDCARCPAPSSQPPRRKPSCSGPAWAPLPRESSSRLPSQKLLSFQDATVCCGKAPSHRLETPLLGRVRPRAKPQRHWSPSDPLGGDGLWLTLSSSSPTALRVLGPEELCWARQEGNTPPEPRGGTALCSITGSYRDLFTGGAGDSRAVLLAVTPGCVQQTPKSQSPAFVPSLRQSSAAPAVPL